MSATLRSRRPGPDLAPHLAAERDTPRCGVCDQPSSTPLCHRCRAVVGSRRQVLDDAPLPCPSCPGRAAHHPGPCA